MHFPCCCAWQPTHLTAVRSENLLCDDEIESIEMLPAEKMENDEMDALKCEDEPFSFVGMEEEASASDGP